MSRKSANDLQSHLRSPYHLIRIAYQCCNGMLCAHHIKGPIVASRCQELLSEALELNAKSENPCHSHAGLGGLK
jgi:hypothetical protein